VKGERAASPARSKPRSGSVPPGRRTVKTEPLPGSLATVTSPPIMRQGPDQLYSRTGGLMLKLHQRRPGMKVKDVMHKGVDWVSPDTPATELAKLMCEHDIGAIPIGENDRLIGMVTDRDVVCKGLAQDSFDLRRATARDVMTPGIHCCRD